MESQSDRLRAILPDQERTDFTTILGIQLPHHVSPNAEIYSVMGTRWDLITLSLFTADQTKWQVSLAKSQTGEREVCSTENADLCSLREQESRFPAMGTSVCPSVQ